MILLYSVLSLWSVHFTVFILLRQCCCHSISGFADLLWCTHVTALFLFCVDSNVAVNLRHKKLSKIVASRSKMFTTELRCIHFRTEITYVILNCSYGVCVCVCVCVRLICTLEEKLLVQESIPRKEISVTRKKLNFSDGSLRIKPPQQS